MDATWHDAGADEPAADGTLREVVAAGQPVLLGRVAGAWLAVAGDCTHDACPLVDGVLVGGELECTCHGARFDLATGAVLAPPATAPLATWDVQAAGGRLAVRPRHPEDSR
jgi:3-phenylpropionate/trans-cinnamate dioxygenase ferredoxin subunit